MRKPSTEEADRISLTRYGQHDEHCERNYAFGRDLPCTCGLDEALAAVAAGSDAALHQQVSDLRERLSDRDQDVKIEREALAAAQSDRERYRALLAELLEPRPRDLTLIEWLDDWTARVRSALDD